MLMANNPQPPILAAPDRCRRHYQPHKQRYYYYYGVFVCSLPLNTLGSLFDNQHAEFREATKKTFNLSPFFSKGVHLCLHQAPPAGKNKVAQVAR